MEPNASTAPAANRLRPNRRIGRIRARPGDQSQPFAPTLAAGSERSDGAVQGNSWRSIRAAGRTAALGSAFFLALACCTASPAATEAKAPPRFDLRILHVNDHHSHLEPETHQLVLGGSPRVVSEMARLAAGADHLLKIHAGDAITGTLFYSLYQGAADAALMSQVCFDAFALGKHEFDQGDGVLAGFLGHLARGGCGTAVLAANVVPAPATPLRPTETHSLIQPYAVLQRGGHQIGLIGIDVAVKTRQSSSPLPSTAFLDETETAQRYIDLLGGMGIDKIVLVTHQGFSADLRMAPRLRGVDVIIGGDSHTLLGPFEAIGLQPQGDYPTMMQDRDGKPVCVAQAWQYAYLVGELNVSFAPDGTIDSCRGTPHLLLGDRFERRQDASRAYVAVTEETRGQLLREIHAMPQLSVVIPDAAAEVTLGGFAARVEALQGQRIGEVVENLCSERVPGDASSRLCRGTDGHALGGDVQQLVAEAFRRRSFEAEIALQNGGGVRTDLPAGPLSISAVYAMLPFSNMLVNLDMTGAELVQVLEEAVSYAVRPGGSKGSFPYAAGLRWQLDLSRPAGSRFSRVEVRRKRDSSWSPLDFSAHYRVVVNSFLAAGKDGYQTLGRIAADPARVQDTYITYAQGFIDFVEQDLAGRVNRLPASEYSTRELRDPGGLLR